MILIEAFPPNQRPRSNRPNFNNQNHQGFYGQPPLWGVPQHNVNFIHHTTHNFQQFAPPPIPIILIPHFHGHPPPPPPIMYPNALPDHSFLNWHYNQQYLAHQWHNHPTQSSLSQNNLNLENSIHHSGESSNNLSQYHNQNKDDGIILLPKTLDEGDNEMEEIKRN
ncbi:hypothetical protein ACQ4LE_003869 [Meloidogyne hapla]